MAVQTVNGDLHTLIQTIGHIIRCWIADRINFVLTTWHMYLCVIN